MATRPFPRTAFLVLGVLSLVASVILIVRAVGVEATSGRVVAAIGFATSGVVFVAAYVAGGASPR